MPDRGYDEEKVSGIPAGSSIRRGGSGRSNGIPTGSGIRRGGGSGGGSGIPTGSNIRKGKKKRSGIPTGSAVRRGGSGGGSRSGIPAGSKYDDDFVEFEAYEDDVKDWSEWNARRGKGSGRGGKRGTVNHNSVSGIPHGSRVGANGFTTRRTAVGVPPGASTAKGRGRKRNTRTDGVPSGATPRKDDVALVERKDAAGPVEVVDDQKGIVEAFVSVTGVKDNVDDVIEPGAYAKTLAERTPKGVWSHAWEHPVSKTLDIKELLPGDPGLPETLADGTKWPTEAGALWVKTQFNLDSDRGREAYSMVKFFGDDGSWSIGYRVPKNGAVKDAKTGVRKIKELSLYEYSPVLHGAAPLAKTRSVKSLVEAKAALEDAGYDTDGLEWDEKGFDPEGLDADEIMALKTAYEVVGAYLDGIGEKDTLVADEEVADHESDDIGWLADELAEVLDEADYAELLDYAAAFDQAYAYGGDADAEVAIDEFLDVLDAEIEADPDMAGLAELISAVLDDRYPEGLDDAEDIDEDDLVDEDESNDLEDEYEDDDEAYAEDDESEGEDSDDAESEEYDEDVEFEYDGGGEEIVGGNDADAHYDGSEGGEGPDGAIDAGASAASEGGKSLADIRWDTEDIADTIVGAIDWEDARV